MFSWITGPRVSNVIEDLQPDAAFDTTFVEPPETPAHQFAVKAFKHAVFGTPGPEEANSLREKLEKKVRVDAANDKIVDISAPGEGPPSLSPSKPGGILMTPGTAARGRKTVSFGAQVVDNECKRGNAGKSGIPNDCPGKFPSPWTPGTELKMDQEEGKKSRNKLTAALYEARSTTPAMPSQKARARDDNDVTVDPGARISDTEKYWKEQYHTYAERSEKQMKKLVAKQQVAKNFAKKKDGEMTELATRLAEERKRFKNRELELEQQNKDYQERLRQALAANLSASMEITALKNRIATLESSLTVPFSEVQDSKMSFQIYEDNHVSAHIQPTKETLQARSQPVKDQHSSIVDKQVPSNPNASFGKENAQPKSRHMRRQTLPDNFTQLTNSHITASKIGTDSIEAAVILASSPYVSSRPSEPAAKSSQTPRPSTTLPKSPLSLRQPPPSQEVILPKSPPSFASSPLPQPSPDPWMQDLEGSSLPQMDRLAMPLSGGLPYSKPAKPVRSSQLSHHRMSKSVSNTTKSMSSNAIIPAADKPLTSDPKFDVAKAAVHHAETSSLSMRDRVVLPVDRKELARRRLQEKKQRKQAA